VKEWCDAAAEHDSLRAFAVALVESRPRLGRRLFVFRNRNWLRSTTWAWAYAGYILMCSGACRAAARWFVDWRQRTGLRGWMIYNVSKALRVAGREDEALQANFAAAGLPRDRWSTPHDLWLAADALLRGNPQPARRCLENVSRSGLDPEFQFVCSVMEIVAGVLELPREQQARSAAGARRRIVGLMNPAPHFDSRRIYVRYAVRALRLLSHLRGTFLSRLRHVLWDAPTAPR
jgi:hypothetical protein